MRGILEEIKFVELSLLINKRIEKWLGNIFRKVRVGTGH